MLPPRETKGAVKKSTKYEELVAQAQALRLTEGETSNPDDVWRR